MLIVAIAIASCGTGSAPPAKEGGPPEPDRRGVVRERDALPGAPVYDSRLATSLDAAWAARASGYKPRTRHLVADDSPRYTNRLFLESSPYLQQHAHNPVNWYPWGPEAFQTAERLGRPIFLSVGYSTCHWCHVMEEESFEDEEIARYLNEHFVAIKVDREERPDVDAIYMTAVQLMTGRGGWPMSVWLTPERKPFFGGTYFPARDGDRGSSVGFLTILHRVRETYVARTRDVEANSQALTDAVVARLAGAAPGTELPGPDVLKDAVEAFAGRYDATNGGVRGAPKFPSSLPIRLLLRHHRRTKDENSLRMATRTLDKMAAGGMYDQVGGGFHRYSTDERWLVPHFEKMLYDNALLAMAYLEGYQAVGAKEYARVAREILRYADRDMSAAEGGFFSATDADSPTPRGHREEGWYFTWTVAELEEVLGAKRAAIVAAYYGVAEGGNFEGRSILHVSRSAADVAKPLGMPAAQVLSTVEESRGLLYRARAQRPPPHRDDKVLAAWNGLMISAFARGGLVLGEPALVARAERAAVFVLERMVERGRLLRSFRHGRARGAAYLDDYAFMIGGLLDLYEATGSARWLREAIALDGTLEKLYEDKTGGFFMTADDHEALLAREKPSYDGAEPSGTSIQALNLLRLSEFTTDDRYRARVDRLLLAFQERLAASPTSLSELLSAVDFRTDLAKEIVIVAPRSRAEAKPYLDRLRTAFLPNRILVIAVSGADQKEQARLVKLLDGKVPRDGKATAYVCEGGVCDLPTTDPNVFARQIREVRPLASPESGSSPLDLDGRR